MSSSIQGNTPPPSYISGVPATQTQARVSATAQDALTASIPINNRDVEPTTSQATGNKRARVSATAQDALTASIPISNKEFLYRLRYKGSRETLERKLLNCGDPLSEARKLEYAARDNEVWEFAINKTIENVKGPIYSGGPVLKKDFEDLKQYMNEDLTSLSNETQKSVKQWGGALSNLLIIRTSILKFYHEGKRSSISENKRKTIQDCLKYGFIQPLKVQAAVRTLVPADWALSIPIPEDEKIRVLEVVDNWKILSE